MVKPDNLQISAQKIRHLIQQVKDISVLPSVARHVLSEMSETSFSPSLITEFLEVSPGLAQRIIYLAYQQGIDLASVKFSIHRLADRLPVSEIYEVMLGMRVYHTTRETADMSIKRSDLIKHSIAVACAARLLVESSSLHVNRECAYIAGLFHDVGKLVLQELLPKGFNRIMEQAYSSPQDLTMVERSYLGVDHYTLGKDLARLWFLPASICSAIWMHHAPFVMAKNHSFLLARIVYVADMLVRAEGWGASGNLTKPESLTYMAALLGVKQSCVMDTKERLAEYVNKRFERLYLDMDNAQACICDTSLNLAAKLFQEKSIRENEVNQLNQQHQCLLLLKILLEPIESGSVLSNILERILRQWQHLYQTGKVCILLAPQSGDHFLNTVCLDDLGSIITQLCDMPGDRPWIPINFQHMVYEDSDPIAWVFEQFEVDFTLSRTHWVPLISMNRPIGIMAFELNYPTSRERLHQALQETTQWIGSLLGLLLEKQQRISDDESLVEEFLNLHTKPTSVENKLLLEILAEVAAGFAHELNNPLSVISGRAQLLSSEAIDTSFQQALSQIQTNAQEASSMVEALLAFARPPELRLDYISLNQILDEAVQLAQQKLHRDRLDIQMYISHIPQVYVDSAQMVSAIANILVNGVESYEPLSGKVDVYCRHNQEQGMVHITIQDKGCGMDPDTKKKAVYPFFSAKPAGRKRGMGLAYAAHIIQMHGGRLDIYSEVDEGTSIHIIIPIS